ncbi:MAG: glycosyltransferase [Clostridiales bacterium]|nr:glycosyltransferase [Clostridiales bacterium]
MKDVLLDIYFVCLAITLFYAVYYAFLGVIGLFMRKQKYPIIEDQSKFCIFVPCHNEESVVAATVENYTKIQYNPELFDIYFLADNCSDQTAEKARTAIEKAGMKNFYVLERNVDDPAKRGKPHALNWGIQTLEAEDRFYNKYDMFMILDADNFVDADILRHVNSQYWSITRPVRDVITRRMKRFLRRVIATVRFRR